jgi:hypothetical protein
MDKKLTHIPENASKTYDGKKNSDNFAGGWLHYHETEQAFINKALRKGAEALAVQRQNRFRSATG